MGLRDWTQFYVECDREGCEADTPSSGTASAAVREALRDGWKERGGEWFCPKHKRKPRATGATPTHSAQDHRPKGGDGVG